MCSFRRLVVLATVVAVLGNDTLTRDNMNMIHKRIDVDGDGKISIADFMSYNRKQRAQQAKLLTKGLTEKWDKNKDGQLSLTEIINFSKVGSAEEEEDKRSDRSRFELADRNKDDSLDSEEFLLYNAPELDDAFFESAIVASLEIRNYTKGVDMTFEGYLQYLYHNTDAITDDALKDHQMEFLQMDEDSSGGLSAQELTYLESGALFCQNAMKKLFAKADLDRDGTLTAAELEGVHNADDKTLHEPLQYLKAWIETIDSTRQLDSKPRGEL